MKKITIMALHLGYGGIEKAIASLANGLSKNYKVEIVSVYKLYSQPAFPIDKRVKIKYLMNYGPNKKELKDSIKSKKIVKILYEMSKSAKILYLKRKLMINYIKNCNSDVIISTRDIHNKILGKYAKKEVLKIGWEHNHHNNNPKYIKRIINSVKGLDIFVLVSNELKEFYESKIINKPKCVYIPNSLEKIPNKLSKLDTNNIISVGRFSYEKGFNDLIDIMYILKNKNIDFHLELVGDGELFDDIKNQINNLNLNDYVTLHGFRNKEYIDKLLNKSTLYIMTSHTESFGIVLIEAFSHGVPVLAFDSANGAKEIINSDINGYLIENRNKEKMADKIIELLENKEKRVILGRNAYEFSKNFDNTKIINLWDDLIKRKIGSNVYEKSNFYL